MENLSSPQLLSTSLPSDQSDRFLVLLLSDPSEWDFYINFLTFFSETILSGDPDGYLEFCDRHFRGSLDSIQVLTFKASCWMYLGQFEQVEFELNKARELEFPNMEIIELVDTQLREIKELLEKAEMSCQGKDENERIQIFEALLKKYPKLIQIRVRLSQLYGNYQDSASSRNDDLQKMPDWSHDDQGGNTMNDDSENLKVLKAKADDAFDLRDYRGSAELYSNMINLGIDSKESRSEVYKKRGDAYGILQEEGKALEDYNLAIELNKKFAEAYSERAILLLRMEIDFNAALRDFDIACELNCPLDRQQDFILVKYEKVKIFLKQEGEFCRHGSFNKAKDCLRKLQELDPPNSKKYEEKYADLSLAEICFENAEDFYNKKQYDSALKNYEIVIQKSPATLRPKIVSIQILALQRRCQKAFEMCERYGYELNHDADFHYAKGLALSSSGKKKEALNEWKEALRLDPDNKKAASASKVLRFYTEGREALKSQKYNIAEDLLSETLKSNHEVQQDLRSELYKMKGMVCKKLKKETEAIINYNDAILEDITNVEALIERGELNMELERYKEAAFDYGKAMELKKEFNGELKRRKEMAEAKAKGYVEDFYKFLGVQSTANEKEIKKAYHERIRKCHPDKHQNGTDGENEEMNFVSRKLNEANELFKNPEKKKEYDRKLKDYQTEIAKKASKENNNWNEANGQNSNTNNFNNSGNYSNYENMFNAGFQYRSYGNSNSNSNSESYGSNSNGPYGFHYNPYEGPRFNFNPQWSSNYSNYSSQFNSRGNGNSYFGF